mmetsp:Transcript_64056/g.111643  ORF Transcript_64056/g.111643 Transcript_64056/m.111643 type:complete len:89 (-) Transcript_64056:37-303(-)
MRRRRPPDPALATTTKPKKRAWDAVILSLADTDHHYHQHHQLRNPIDLMTDDVVAGDFNTRGTCEERFMRTCVAEMLHVLRSSMSQAN